jgi:hypothetical protein
MLCRYDTSKHLYAVSAGTGEVESPESLVMRRQTSQTIANITLEMLTSLLNIPTPTAAQHGFPASLSPKDLQILLRSGELGLLLNLLKISSESTYELLQTLQAEIYAEDSPHFAEWKEIAEQLNFNLDLLSQLVISPLPSSSLLCSDEPLFHRSTSNRNISSWT